VGDSKSHNADVFEVSLPILQIACQSSGVKTIIVRSLAIFVWHDSCNSIVKRKKL
jgi:hypothetical protein